MAQDPNLERDEMEPQEEMTVTLTLDDGSELECLVGEDEEPDTP